MRRRVLLSINRKPCRSASAIKRLAISAYFLAAPPACGAAIVDPPGGVAIALFPDGLLAAFAPAEALPALPFPVVMDGPAAPVAAGAPVVALPVAAPPALLCAKAAVVERVIAAANTALMSFMMSALLDGTDNKHPR